MNNQFSKIIHLWSSLLCSQHWPYGRAYELSVYSENQQTPNVSLFFIRCKGHELAVTFLVFSFQYLHSEVLQNSYPAMVTIKCHPCWVTIHIFDFKIFAVQLTNFLIYNAYTSRRKSQTFTHCIREYSALASQVFIWILNSSLLPASPRCLTLDVLERLVQQRYYHLSPVCPVILADFDS